MLSLERFIVFDNIPPKEEGVDLDLIWHYPEDCSDDEKIEFAGMFFAFADWSLSLIGERTDYIQTKNHEWSCFLMPENIMICAITKSNVAVSRNIMHVLLEIINDIYHLFFKAPQRDKKNKLLTKDKELMRDVFKKIVESIRWDKLVFLNLWDLKFQLSLTEKQKEDVQAFLNLVINPLSKIRNIAVMMKHQFLFSTFPDKVGRTLQFALTNKFSYLYPNLLRIPHEKFNSMDMSKAPLVWEIGISRTENNIVQIYSPLMYLENNQIQNLLVMKMGRIKIIIGSNDIDFSRPSDIQNISKGLKKKLVEILSLINYVPKENHFVSESFAKIVVKTINKDSTIDYEQHNIRSTDQALVEMNILKSHQFILNYDKIAEISFPTQNYFYTYFNHSPSLDEVCVYQSSKLSISQFLEKIKPILKE